MVIRVCIRIVVAMHEIGNCGSRLICRDVCVCMNWDWLCDIGLAEWS